MVVVLVLELGWGWGCLLWMARTSVVTNVEVAHPRFNGGFDRVLCSSVIKGEQSVVRTLRGEHQGRLTAQRGRTETERETDRDRERNG